MRNIRDLNKTELSNYLTSLGEPKYRLGQIFTWLHKNMVFDMTEMTNVSKRLISQIESDFLVDLPIISEEFVSKKDDTKKYLIKLTDGNIIETVLMKYKYGLSLCISSQVGCAMGCNFCASGLNGLVRNLSAHELLAQVYLVSKHNNKHINNIVIMGTGEPLTNFDNIISFLNIINDEDGQNISLRNIAISTCGIVNNIYKLADNVEGILSTGNQTGEGWFLTGEMVELIKEGITNIVCVQPFACLPNHIVGKAVIKRIRNLYPESNIVAIDYDPGASHTNQVNRIKLMLTVAKEKK